MSGFATMHTGSYEFQDLEEHALAEGAAIACRIYAA